MNEKPLCFELTPKDEAFLRSINIQPPKRIGIFLPTTLVYQDHMFFRQDELPSKKLRWLYEQMRCIEGRGSRILDQEYIDALGAIADGNIEQDIAELLHGEIEQWGYGMKPREPYLVPAASAERLLDAIRG